MIRINLLHVRALKERRKASGVLQLLIILAVVIVEILACWFVHTGKSDEVAKVKDQTAAIQALLNEQRARMSDNQDKRAELEQIRKKQEVIQQLQAGRTGPKTMLYEVIRILSKGGGPTISEETQRQLRQQSLGIGYNRAWDYQKLWMETFTESDRNVTISGLALDVEDISEFQRRLNLSQYFEDMRWIASPEQRANTQGHVTYSFTLKGRVLFQ